MSAIRTRLSPFHVQARGALPTTSGSNSGTTTSPTMSVLSMVSTSATAAGARYRRRSLANRIQVSTGPAHDRGTK
ncbi:hypothetical protein Val02_92350 [Virgisporangium aliadipatigenens]|uniref:Uncharacterized protein n=1 Tax=Virgisporangium aliadipatigenens TaxID=741659 RepID=A0A8J3YVB9_9ACTN|nr:hypothetical protein Val02_92350 [Virgisporangium aliadipatigenens]